MASLVKLSLLAISIFFSFENKKNLSPSIISLSPGSEKNELMGLKEHRHNTSDLLISVFIQNENNASR